MRNLCNFLRVSHYAEGADGVHGRQESKRLRVPTKAILTGGLLHPASPLSDPVATLAGFGRWPICIPAILVVLDGRG